MATAGDERTTSEATSPAAAAVRRSVTAPWWLAVATVVALSSGSAVALMLLPAHAAADVTHYKYWARLLATEGVAGAYSGQYPETAAIYPPLTMYGYWLAGVLYERLIDPDFEIGRALGSRALTLLVKLVAVVPHLAAIPVIFRLLAGRFGPGVALVAAAAYGLNPAALFDIAYWGQPDPVHALLLVIAIWLFEDDRPVGGWAFVGLAAATKPQAWALLPFLGYLSLRRFGWARSAQGGLAAAVAALIVCLPYVLAGTVGQLLTLPRVIAETMPVASANAHNLWWIVTEARPDFVLDADPLLGPLTYRHVALILAAAVLSFALWRTDPRARRGGLSAMAAYAAFGWFLVTTRAHENHPFFVLPLLLMAAPRSRFLAVLFAMITITLFFNMTFHDFSLAELRTELFAAETWVRLQLLNAAANVALFMVWSVWLLENGRDR